jgi:hypothetical protein
MADERTLMDRLKERLEIDGDDEDQLLNDLLEESNAAACAVADTTELPATHQFLVVRMAAAEYRQLGLEGEKSHSEGGVSHGIDLLPEHLQDMLKALRPARVVDM